MADILFQALLFPQGTGSNSVKKKLYARKNGAIKACIMKSFTGSFQKGKALSGMVTYDGSSIILCGYETWFLLYRKNIKHVNKGETN